MLDYNPFENFSRHGKVKSNLEEYQHPQDEKVKDVLEEPIEKPNFLLIYVFSVFLVLILIFRLLDLQIAQGAKQEYLAEGNRLRNRDIQASRGNIYDCNNQIIAKNVAGFNLELYPADLPKDKNEREKIYKLVEEFSNIKSDELRNKIDDIGLFSLEPIVLKENISRDEALLLEVRYKDISGIVIAKHPEREYKVLPGLAHILGYVGKVNEKELNSDSDLKLTSIIGKSGLEQVYDKDIRGTDGKEQVEVDSYGQIQRILATLEPVPGNNLYLTINMALQEKTAQILEVKTKETNTQKGVVIAINPQNGSVLALVNIPSYDNNIFSSTQRNQKYQELLDDKNQPMLNRAIAGIYPSGSVIKPVVASAGLQENVISADTTIYAPKEITIGEWVFPDWKEHGYVNVRKAIAVSSNVFFYAVGGGYDKISGLGLNRLRNYFDKFGYGNPTGIDLPGEASGLIPDESWKKKIKGEPWYQGDTYHLAIGQGDFLTTPLQMLNAVSSIANNGKLYQPHLLDKETDSQGKLVKNYQSKVIRENFIDPANLQIVREGMRLAVTEGSARQLNDLPVTSAGKTGTAQTPEGNTTHAWFTAFAPYENPQIAIIILIEYGGEGNVVAEPVAKEILQYYFDENKNH